MSFLDGAGTPEAAWQAAAPWTAWQQLDPGEAAGSRVVLAAPHPDDEVLGAGGCLARLAAAGASVSVVAVTDGGASHEIFRAGPPPELGRLRAAETVEALARLDLGDVPVDRLGVPDGGAARAEDAVAAALAARLRPGDWCLATWRGDGHPDHEAVGRAAARACADTGARLLEYLVWTWHWAVPGDPRVPWHRAHAVPLDASLAAAKREAVRAYRTQVEPVGDEGAVLGPEVLARLTRDVEVLLA